MAETDSTAKSSAAASAIARPVVLQPAKLIGSVNVQPATVQPGQSVLVEVVDVSGKPLGGSTVVTINGVPAGRRYLQFLRPGDYTLQVRAVAGSYQDTATAKITVAGTPLMFRRSLAAPAVSVVPMIKLSQSFNDHYVATFTVGTAAPPTPAPASGTTATTTPAPAAGTAATTTPAPAASKITLFEAKLAPAAMALQTPPKAAVLEVGKAVAVTAPAKPATPQATSYKWTFGDGTSETTQAPSVTHDYFHAIQVGTVSHSFDVTCTVVHDNVTVSRTLVLHSAYELCKSYGTIVPHIDSDVFATWRKGTGFTASMTVYNIEAAPITLTDMGFVPLSDNPDALLPPPVFTKMQTPITIKAKSASALGVVISLAQLAPATKLGSAVPGFIVYYRGTHVEGGKTTPVLFSRTIRIPLSDSGGAWLSDAGSAPKLTPIAWDLVKTSAFQLSSAPSLKLTSDASNVTTDAATQTVAVSLDSTPQTAATKSQARLAINSALVAGLAGKGA